MSAEIIKIIAFETFSNRGTFWGHLVLAVFHQKLLMTSLKVSTIIISSECVNESDGPNFIVNQN